MTTRYSTDDVAPNNRFAFWREAVCQSYVHLACESDNQKQFYGEIMLDRWSRLSTSFVSGNNQLVNRRISDIARSTEASFLVSLQCRETGTVCQRGSSAVLQPGDFALYSSIDPYRLQIPDGFRQLVLQIPREALLQRLPNADLLTGRRVGADSNLGKIVSNNILTFASSLAEVNPTMQACLQETILDLVATGLASLANSPMEMARPAQLLMIRADTYIQDNLADPELDRSRLAQALGVSTRRLSELFRQQGRSVAAHIRNSRLQQIALDLADPRYNALTISEIAMRWGLNNFQHFSTIFKKQFGASPRAYRKQPDCRVPMDSKQ